MSKFVSGLYTRRSMKFRGQDSGESRPIRPAAVPIPHVDPVLVEARLRGFRELSESELPRDAVEFAGQLLADAALAGFLDRGGWLALGLLVRQLAQGVTHHSCYGFEITRAALGWMDGRRGKLPAELQGLVVTFPDDFYGGYDVQQQETWRRQAIEAFVCFFDLILDPAGDAGGDLPELTPEDVAILRYLGEQPGVARPQVDIATGAELDRKTVSVRLEILRKYGYVKRPEGKRRLDLITPVGISRLKTILENSRIAQNFPIVSPH